jgi:hypothetical protein
MHKIGIVIIATNAYFVLGIRFIKKFIHHYKGNSAIKFHFFSEIDPCPYLSECSSVVWHEENHKNWLDGTNSKFKNIIKLSDSNEDYIYYFDADTNINKNFDENWFLGELVGGEHYGNRTWLANGVGLDKFEKSKAYVPPNSHLPYMYYYGAFFGGRKEKVIKFCETLRDWQIEDKKIPYEPSVNDESYINAYFHYNQPTIVYCEQFVFNISDKGGIGETRNTNLDLSEMKKRMIENKDKLIDIISGKLIIK